MSSPWRLSRPHGQQKFFFVFVWFFQLENHLFALDKLVFQLEHQTVLYFCNTSSETVQHLQDHWFFRRGVATHEHIQIFQLENTRFHCNTLVFQLDNKPNTNTTTTKQHFSSPWRLSRPHGLEKLLFCRCFLFCFCFSSQNTNCLQWHRWFSSQTNQIFVFACLQHL